MKQNTKYPNFIIGPQIHQDLQLVDFDSTQTLDGIKDVFAVILKKHYSHPLELKSPLKSKSKSKLKSRPRSRTWYNLRSRSLKRSKLRSRSP